MKTALTLAALLLSASCAPMWPYGVEPAPDGYAAVTPRTAIIKFQLPLDQVNSACHGLSHDTTALRVDGCALLGSFACIVIWPLPDPLRGYDEGRLAAIYSHEVQGHCNGLIHNPDGHGWVPLVETAP